MLLLATTTAAPHRDGPCLCIFDIDRTLTASQAAARKGSHNQCPAAHSFDHPYIKDQARREKRRAKREERERRHAGGRDAEEREMLAAPSSKERSGKKKRERRRDPTGYDI